MLTRVESDRYRAKGDRRGCETELCREWGIVQRPFCMSSMIADTVIGGVQAISGLSGLLYDGE